MKSLDQLMKDELEFLKTKPRGNVACVVSNHGTRAQIFYSGAIAGHQSGVVFQLYNDNESPILLVDEGEEDLWKVYYRYSPPAPESDQ